MVAAPETQHQLASQPDAAPAAPSAVDALKQRAGTQSGALQGAAPTAAAPAQGSQEGQSRASAALSFPCFASQPAERAPERMRPRLGSRPPRCAPVARPSQLFLARRAARTRAVGRSHGSAAGQGTHREARAAEDAAGTHARPGRCMQSAATRRRGERMHAIELGATGAAHCGLCGLLRVALTGSRLARARRCTRSNEEEHLSRVSLERTS